MFEKKISDNEKKKMQKEARKSAKGTKTKSKVCETIVSVIKIVIIPLLVAGVAACGLYIAMQNQAAAEELKSTVVVAVKDIPQNTWIAENEVEEYFTEMRVLTDAVPCTAVSEIKELPKDGFYVEHKMAKAQMVISDNIAKKDEVLDKYRNGYEKTSLAAEAFAGSVNGRVRKGDIVDIYAVDPATEELVLMVSDVYVESAYDTSGNLVTLDDEVATSVTVYTTPEEVEKLNQAVVYGGIQMYMKVK